MSKKKTMLLVAGVLLAAGAVAAVSAPGDRRGRGGGEDGFGRGSFWRGGAVTADEWDSRTRERFARLDKNGDGVLDAAEIEASLAGGRGGRGAAPDDAMLKRFLARFGAGADGRVTKDAFNERIKKMFAELDLNNDGKITDDDLPPMLRGRGVLSGEGPAAGAPPMRRGRGGERGGGGERGMEMLGWLRGADTNKDGAITLDEALALGAKRFARLDRNGDGVVDKADFDAMGKEMADYRVRRFIHQYGADKEGKVTREQFYKLAKERFAQADADGDGRLTRGERGGGRDGGWRGKHGRGAGGEGRDAMRRGEGGEGPGGRGPVDRGGEAPKQ